ncbi:unnamed protein product [Schistocephalus solidus]|uniref:SurE domain-containing protein n=1 Tax=Schistocephalus solidus TaxID=70667 RepID=A0A183SD01_SCHSO|nr:unnamed protein product [Schistocephalus solidus]
MATAVDGGLPAALTAICACVRVCVLVCAPYRTDWPSGPPVVVIAQSPGQFAVSTARRTQNSVGDTVSTAAAVAAFALDTALAR